MASLMASSASSRRSRPSSAKARLKCADPYVGSSAIARRRGRSASLYCCRADSVAPRTLRASGECGCNAMARRLSLSASSSSPKERQISARFQWRCASLSFTAIACLMSSSAFDLCPPSCAIRARRWSTSGWPGRISRSWPQSSSASRKRPALRWPSAIARRSGKETVASGMVVSEIERRREPCSDSFRIAKAAEPALGQR